MPPLRNRRILVTRPKDQASPLATLLAAAGATPILIPTIELVPPKSWCALDAALACLRSYDLVIFTSGNAVQSFAARAHQLQLPSHPKRIAAVGPATAAAAATLNPDDPTIVLPPLYTADSLADYLVPSARDQQILFPRAANAAQYLPETLEAAGASVTQADTYQTVIPQASIAALAALFRNAPPDAITFTSASTAQNLAALLDAAHLTIPAGTALASIGPITTRAMQYLNLEPTLEAEESTIPALVEALAKHYSN